MTLTQHCSTNQIVYNFALNVTHKRSAIGISNRASSLPNMRHNSKLLPALLIHGLPALPILLWWLTLPPLRRTALIMHRYTLPTTVHLLLYVGSVFDVLVESADVAANFVPRFERERNDRDEALDR